MKCAILLGLALLTFSCSKNKDPHLTSKSPDRANYPVYKVTNLSLTDTLGNISVISVNAYLTIGPTNFAYATVYGNTVVQYNYDGIGTLYMNGEYIRCGEFFEMNFISGGQILQMTSVPFKNLPASTCFVKLKANKIGN